MNILFCLSLLLVAVTTTQAAPDCSDFVDVSEITIECAECNDNDKNCCGKKSEDGDAVCFLIAVAIDDDDAGARTLMPGFTPPQFGGQSMAALYPGNYYAQHSLLNMCARETFPYVCQRKQMFDYTYKCAVNIPYCQRIPCSPGENDALDKNIEKCLRVPGCCYDQPLDYHRRYYGQKVLPGVPVCHLAIRNTYFQKEAREYVAKYRGWDPLVTSCLIDSFKDYIYMNKKACDGVKALEYFGFKAKKAGWSGITEQECLLIGGCWRENYGCHYEPKVTKLRIRSAQEIRLPKHFTPAQIYGQPKCLDLDYNMESKEFLTSLHYCVASGCQLDTSISDRVIQYYMQNITAYLPPNMANLFRHDVESGLVGPDNFQTQIEYYNRHPNLVQQHNLYTQNYMSTIGQQAYSHMYRIPTPGIHQGFSPYYNPMTNPYGYGQQRNLNDEDADGEGGRTFDWGGVVDTYVPPHPQYPITYQQYGYGNLGAAIYSHSSMYNPHNSHYYCPFRNPNLRGFPPLAGRFDGCCERPLCYMNRQTVADQTSGAASYYRPWSAWGPCSKSCGKGIQYRRRQCIGMSKCVGKDEEERECTGYYQCHGGKWMSWSKWSKCTGRCGEKGTTTRTRKCTPGYRCSGEYYQTKNCRGACRG